MKLLFFIFVAIFCALPLSAQAQADATSKVSVVVSGPGVQRSGTYQMDSPATIEQAFALAEGWAGYGENGMAAHECRLFQHLGGKKTVTRVRIHIDRKTKQIQVLDQVWKDYHLLNGDIISLGIVVS